MLAQILMILAIVVVVIAIGMLILIARAHHKVPQGRALIRTGIGGAKVTYDSGLFVIPIMHRVEEMDISLKTIEVHRAGAEGLICKDNLRADIKVVFFVRINKNAEDILNVAQTIGCARASDQNTLNGLFDAKFSEALKTVGKQFDFEELYTARESFKKEILKTIGSDLNGYELDDCAIDYLEQTPIGMLRADNIMDSEGIRKIEQLTSQKAEETNHIRREREKIIRKQDVEAREAILQLDLQQREKEERQKRAIAEISATQAAEAQIIVSIKNKEATLKQIENEQEIGKASENKDREILVARKNKERTDAVETQRVETDKMLEIERKERAVGEMRYDKEKALENKNREIQSVIKERKAEEKKTIEEEQRILDLQQISTAEREKKVLLIHSQQEAESQAIKLKTAAETDRMTAEVKAQQMIIEANAQKETAVRKAEARKIEAEALAAEEATVGLAEANVMNAKTEALERQGTMEAKVLEQKTNAEAKGIEVKAEANRKRGLAEVEVQSAGVDVKTKEGSADANILELKGTAEATVIEKRAAAEAKGLEQKAQAMKMLDGVGKDHEEFKLRLEQQRQIQLADIDAQRQIAVAQADVLAQAMKTARIDIVGGETQFFNSMMSAIGKGKSLERTIENSPTLLEIKENLLSGGKDNVLEKVKTLAEKYGFDSNTLKNLSVSALLAQTYSKASKSDKGMITQLLEAVSEFGLEDKRLG